MLTSLYPKYSDKDMIITAIILLTICGLYFLKKFIDFLQARYKILQGKKDFLNPYHIFFFIGQTVKEQKETIATLTEMINFQELVKEEKDFLNTFLTTYQEVYQEHLENINQGQKLRVKNSKGMLMDAYVYTQKFDDANFYLQGIIIGDNEKIFKVKVKNGVKTENKNFKKMFKKYNFIKKAE